MLGPYVAVFFGSMAVDSVPVFAPPAWMLMVLLVVKFKLQPWLTVALGSTGSCFGRWFLSLYMPKAARKVFDREENENISFLGRKLGGRFWPAFLFTLGYCFTPLSSTTLFTAAGMARVDVLPIMPAFFIGKFASDAMMVMSGRAAVHGVKDILRGEASPKGLIFGGVSLLLITAVMFVDWRPLFRRGELRFRFRIWRKA